MWNSCSTGGKRAPPLYLLRGTSLHFSTFWTSFQISKRHKRENKHSHTYTYKLKKVAFSLLSNGFYILQSQNKSILETIKKHFRNSCKKCTMRFITNLTALSSFWVVDVIKLRMNFGMEAYTLDSLEGFSDKLQRLRVTFSIRILAKFTACEFCIIASTPH